MTRLFLYIFIAIGMVACKNENSAKANESGTEESAENSSGSKYTLTPFEPSTAFDDAVIKSYTYKDSLFDFKLGDGEYQLGQQTPDADAKMYANSAKGQHIHLIVDNAPYAAKYESSFKHGIEDGEHYLLAFLSRSYHESIKTAEAHTAQKVLIKNNSLESFNEIKAPMLFYSRPKGTYVGEDTKKVMLDFFLVNTDLKENKVIANINGEKHRISTWQPYYIEGLPFGENTIELTLVDKDGKKVETPLNPVTRKFTLKEASELEK